MEHEERSRAIERKEKQGCVSVCSQEMKVYLKHFHAKLPPASGHSVTKAIVSPSVQAGMLFEYSKARVSHYLAVNEVLVLMQCKSNCRQSLNHN